MGTGWATLDELGAARGRFEAGLRWRRPVQHGLAFAQGDRPPQPGGALRVAEARGIAFARVNDAHLLPAAVLATVVDWQAGTGSVRVTRAQLDRAAELVAPAEACRDVDHPNLWTWRELLAREWPAGDVVAVFDADPAEPTDDPYVAALRELVRREPG